MKNRLLHVIVWKLVRWPFKAVMRLKYNFRTEAYTVKGPAIILSNHTSNTDPMMVGGAFRQQMYFVANDSLVNDPRFFVRAMCFLQAPIGRQKAGSGAGTIKAILRVLKEGCNVCLFPEGNTTWDGVTRPVPAATAKLVRSSGATLVTYRLEGTYLHNPRWALKSKRRGECRGHVVGIYTPEELKAMSNSQVMNIINKDLHYDAIEEQKKNPREFTGKNLCAGIETLLYYCPACGAMHTIRGEGDFVRCTACGASAKMNSFALLEGGEFKVDNVRNWYALQKEKLASVIEESGEIFRDRDFTMYELESGGSKRRIAGGDISLNKTALSLPGEVSIPLTDLSGMSNFKSTDLFLRTAEGTRYLLKAKEICCTSKYIDACTMLGCNVGLGI